MVADITAIWAVVRDCTCVDERLSTVVEVRPRICVVDRSSALSAFNCVVSKLLSCARAQTLHLCRGQGAELRIGEVGQRRGRESGQLARGEGVELRIGPGLQSAEASELRAVVVSAATCAVRKARACVADRLPMPDAFRPPIWTVERSVTLRALSWSRPGC